MTNKAVAVLGFLLATCPSFAAGPPWLDGGWSGTVFQPNFGNYSINVVADSVSETYSATYPTLGCTTKWALLSSTASQATFNEIVLSGSSCINGRVIVTKVAKGQYATYSFFVDASSVFAFTTMKKTAAQ